MKIRDFIKDLEAQGFTLIRHNGTSHAIYRSAVGKIISIPVHNKEIKPCVLGKYKSQARRAKS